MLGSDDLLKRAGVALLIGFLIGLERERSEIRKGKPVFAGVRTFPLIALVAAVTTSLTPVVGVALAVMGFAAVAAITAVAYARTPDREAGATTEIAALVTYALGTLAGAGQLVTASAIGVAVAVLLAAKVSLERFSRALDEDELVAALELAVISAIVLPLLPDQSYGPFGGVNPYASWMVVVLVSGVSFAGFIAARVWGKRKGMLAAGIVGALASSTAVTTAMAGRARENPQAGRTLAAATTAASVVMCLRVIVLLAVTGPSLVRPVLPIVGTMAVVGIAAVLWLSRRDGEPEANDDRLRLGNPFSLKTAVAFGVLYALIKLGVNAGRHYLGESGVLIVAAVGGIADVDAITVALARTARSDPSQLLIVGVGVASIVNTLVKATIAVIGGAGPFRRDVALALGAQALAGTIAVLVMTLG